MAELGEGIAVTMVKLDDDPEYHYAELQVCYPNGEPFFVEDDLQITLVIDGEERAAQPNLECSVNQSLLEPGTRVSFKIEENIEDEIKQTRQKIQDALKLIIDKEREEKQILDQTLDQEGWFSRKAILTGAFMQGVGEGAIGLVEFVGDTAVLAAKASWYHSQVTVANNLEAAWETAYSQGNINDFFSSVAEKDVADFATAFGVTPQEMAVQVAEAYEIFAFVMADNETKAVLLQFAADYVAAQAKVELVKIGGSAAFDIILTAILAVTTGGVGNAAQAGAKIRHFSYFKKLAESLKTLVRQLRRKSASKAISGKLDSTVQHKVTMPAKQKLEPRKSKQADSQKTDGREVDDGADGQRNDSSSNDQQATDQQTKTNDGESKPKDTTEQGKNNQGKPCQTDSKTCMDGEPISLVTGEEIFTQSDFELPGVLALSWQRTYRSSNPKNTGLGFGWNHAFSEQLTIDGGRLQYHTNEARTVTFNLPAVGAVSRNIAEKLQVSRSRQDQFMLRSTEPGAQLEKHFTRSPGESGFLLTSISDPYQNGFQFIYRAGLLRQIEASHGDQWQLEYNQQATLAAVHKLDGDGNAKTLVHYTYDQYNDLIQATDANGNSERYVYHNHIIQQRTLKSGYSFYFKWDGTDHQARCIEQFGDPIDGKDTYHYHFAWDEAQRRVAITDTRGGEQCYQFNERGLPVYYRDAEGGETVTRYDELGNAVSVKTANGHYENYTYDQQQRLIIFANAAGNKTELVRDNGGLISYIYDPLGQKWSRKYDALGALIAQSNPLGESIQYRYNPMGLVSSVTNPLGQSWHYIWDHRGQLTAVRDPKGQHTRYSYNSDWQLQKITLPDGHSIEYQYDASGNCTAITSADGKTQRFEYNALGLVTRAIDSEGRSTDYQYNGLSQVVRKVDPNGHILRYHYDGERNLIGLTNQNGEHYHLTYDLNERLIQEVGFDGRVQHYQYDAEGNLIVQSDFSRDGKRLLNQIAFQRDAQGRLLKQSQVREQSLHPLNEYQYDALGRLTQASNAHRQLKWVLDPVGRVIEDHQDKHITRHNYNPTGQRINTTLPDGSQIDYGFDELGPFQHLSFDGQLVADIHRDQFGRETQRRHGNQLDTEYRYDPQGRLTAQRTGRRTGEQGFQAVSQRRLRYNNHGQLAQIDDQLRGRTRYHYDRLDRLKKVDGPNPERFIHDPAGNLLATQTPEDQCAPGRVQGNRLDFHGDHHYTYDDLGNRVTQSRGKNQKQLTRYAYNPLNQLVALEQNRQVTHYRYDPLGRRIQKAQPGNIVDFLWLDEVLLSETHQQQNNITQHKTYLFEPNSFSPLALVQDKKIYHYHLDHLGTPQEITDAKGKLVWAVSYRAYGNLAVAFRQEIENNLRFQGQYFDEESGLHYNRFRYYDPGCGRFISQDPIGLLGGVNNYLYVPNPVQWIDPLGLSCKENTWNAFQADHKGQFANTSEASKAYTELKQQQSPWPIGYDPAQNVLHLKPGDTFNMIVDEGMGDMPGKFATFDDIPDAAYGRDQLAIKKGWKPTLDNVVTYRVKKPFDVYYDPVHSRPSFLLAASPNKLATSFTNRSVRHAPGHTQSSNFIRLTYRSQTEAPLPHS